ncbi:MAG TPA: family 1 glycosylhydrolase [Gemmatimonadales bacterium]|nr:family 1 glycosylhydrolase [Gemmatimonadales bacterium]
MPDEVTMELWGGVECTVNRVGDVYFDQVRLSGHHERIDDLDRFAALGIKRLRYPVLWERTAPNGLPSADWSWADERLGRLRELGIEPIVGLMHHGSGPPGTSLVDPALPDRLAEFAQAVAERYPWVRDYTPVNEPLTTARFSCLYGHWYPHLRSGRAFARALLGQIKAVVLAMRAIRSVNASACLIQTEDLAGTHSTQLLAYQAAFENDRRWLTFDLLTGSLHPQARMWRHLRDLGIGTSELEWFQANACAPDILGLNHYLSSERFLDHRTDLYPATEAGGNGRHRYADVPAVRIARGSQGPARLFREAWERYGLPLAVTEAHNGCTREEQVRWFVEIWRTAASLRESGIDLRAVTAWALLGSFDWDSLVTSPRGRYEPGAFDVRSAPPRPTMLAPVLGALARGDEPDHPVLVSPGWWRRPSRFLHPPVELHGEAADLLQAAPAAARPLAIIGATGTLGRAFSRIAELRGLRHVLLARRDVDIADAAAVRAMLAGHGPWAVVNAAGYVRVDEAEDDAARCRRENAEGAAVLAGACAAAGIPLLTFSSDLVFDGVKGAPYVESDAPRPLNVYGESKAEAEAAVTRRHPGALIVRTSAFFGPWDPYNFVTSTLGALAEGRRVPVLSDVTITATHVPDLANACLDLLIDGESGIWHLSHPEPVTWHELAVRAAAIADLDASGIQPIPLGAMGLRAVRPRYCALGSERGLLLPRLDAALERCIEAIAEGGPAREREAALEA